MSTPQNQAQKQQPDRSALDIHAASHKAAMTAAQGHGDALAKLHASISQMMGGQQQAQQPQDPYANMPDPGQWVSDDPHGAAAYADQIMQRFAELVAQMGNQMAAPAGPPDLGIGAGPAVGGDTTGAY